MTHDILQSDIELAIKLREDQHPDDEIILALAQRGVDPAKAAQLVDDLRKGIRPTPLSAIPMEFTLPRRSRTRSVPSADRPAEPAPRAKSRSERPARATAQGAKTPAAFWVTIAVFVGILITVAIVVLIQRFRAGSNDAEELPPKPAPSKADQAPRPVLPKAVRPTANTPAPTLALELQADGLHFGGKLVTSSNVLATVANVLGVPTRTNQDAAADVVIYAYDRQGLLIYSENRRGTKRIVLDCDASGGANGTTSPFSGALQFEDQVIAAGTDSRTLAAIKNLGLHQARAGGSVWGGRCGSLELVFAYLQSPQHLSLIEIDLR